MVILKTRQVYIFIYIYIYNIYIYIICLYDSVCLYVCMYACMHGSMYVYIYCMVGAKIIERKLRSTKVRLFTVPCCSTIIFPSEGMGKKKLILT